MDSICINQADANERNHQVRLMQKIYGLAEHVFFHIGHQEHEHEVAKRALDLRFVEVDGQRYQRREHGGLLPTDVMAELARGFNRSRYASRLWVVQELVLGRQVSFVIDDCIIPLPELEEGARRDQGYPEALAGFLLKILNARRQWHLFPSTSAAGGGATTTTNKTRGSRLSSLLWDYQKHRCQLVSDRVYALLGICCEEIPIDYNLDPKELSLSILAHLIPEQLDLDTGTDRIRSLINSLEAALGVAITETDLGDLSRKLERDHQPEHPLGDLGYCDARYCKDGQLHVFFERLATPYFWDIGYDSTHMD